MFLASRDQAFHLAVLPNGISYTRQAKEGNSFHPRKKLFPRESGAAGEL